ncbi:MAG: protein phosphatase 2C domain-containing protein [Gammaproteobacteria bacterium]|nr:protein phosphatase 2C domain-containing protein [Gammaproteobacteria bacterium]
MSMSDVAAFQILGPRRRQEDSALHVRHGRGRLLVVADGMGGEPAGDVASMSAVLGFEKGFGVPPDEPEDNVRWATRFIDGLRGALDGMADALARGDGADGMATTLAAVWAGPDGMRWLSVGDSGIWVSDVFSSYAPTRLNARHGEGNRVDSGLMAAAAPLRAGSVEAEFCVAAIDLHPGPLRLSPGRLILVGSDGMDVLGRVGTPGGWAERGETRLSAEWAEAFRDMSPRDFLSRVEAVLTGGIAEDNATAIALRTPRRRSVETEEYVPGSDAPEREVLGGVST